MSNLYLDGTKLHHHLESVQRWLKGELIAPLHVEVSPTGACNHRCTFCYADHNDHKLGTIKRDVLLQLMRDMGRMGVKSCLFAGDGEPLVHKHCTEAIRVGAESGVDMALNSNAVLLTEEKAREALPHLTWARFSVMAHEPGLYADIHRTKPEDFQRAIDNIATAARIKREQGLKVTIGIQQVLLPGNGHGVPSLASLARDIGCDYYVLKQFHHDEKNSGYAGDTAVNLMNRYRAEMEEAATLSTDTFTSIIRWHTFAENGERHYKHCLGLPFISQIAGNGKVYTCCPFFGDDRYELGDLNQDSYADIWSSEKAARVRKWVETEQDVSTCMPYCRHHQVNRMCWSLKNPPDHVNFI